jgi:hypothetical protein
MEVNDYIDFDIIDSYKKNKKLTEKYKDLQKFMSG